MGIQILSLSPDGNYRVHGRWAILMGFIRQRSSTPIAVIACSHSKAGYGQQVVGS